MCIEYTFSTELATNGRGKENRLLNESDKQASLRFRKVSNAYNFSKEFSLTSSTSEGLWLIKFSQISLAVEYNSGDQTSLKQYLLPSYLTSVNPLGHPVKKTLENVENV